MKGSGRASREDWCTSGLVILREHGHHAVTIERLCAALEKTKGSFYHHFADLETYHGALLALWERELTDRPMEHSMGAVSSEKRGARLDEAVRRIDHALDVAVRAWALRDARAREAIERVDRRRIDFLTELHRAADHKEARLLAELEYAAFVGAEHLGQFTDARRAVKLGRAMRRALALLAEA